MSINKKTFSPAVLLYAVILLAVRVIAAQDLEANITISAASPGIARVSGRLLKQSNKNWFFTKTIANADGLGARISDFHLFDEQNRNAVAVKKLIDGEYLAAAEARDFEYRVNLEPLANAATRTHVSWTAGEQGILMLDDLLPQFSDRDQPATARIKIELPNEWTIIAGEKRMNGSSFEVADLAKAVLAIGKNWRETQTANLSLAISGEWRFSETEAAQMADEIYTEYRQLFGQPINGKARIVLAHLPPEAKFGRWEAETRGTTATILSADKPFKAQSIQLLHEQLRHEIFHLWIPNGLSLTGNYDWFYEGFTVYQALRTGVRMNQIRFEDLLATLAEAYNLDAFQTNKVSLRASSKNRWNGTNPQVYARGMLVAFLCDAALLRSGKHGDSIENIFRETFRRHRFSNEPADGNQAVLEILENYQPLDSIIGNYIEGAEKINWGKDLDAFGIEVEATEPFVKLKVKAKLSGGQKDLLNKLGYNNWRKISRKTK